MFPSVIHGDGTIEYEFPTLSKPAVSKFEVGPNKRMIALVSKDTKEDNIITVEVHDIEVKKIIKKE